MIVYDPQIRISPGMQTSIISYIFLRVLFTKVFIPERPYSQQVLFTTGFIPNRFYSLFTIYTVSYMIGFMKTFKAEKKSNGKKLVHVICAEFPDAKPSVILKALQNKDIRVNGQKTKTDDFVFIGDEISVYVSDDLLFNKSDSVKEKADGSPQTQTSSADAKSQTSSRSSTGKSTSSNDSRPPYTVVYQDENILVINKSPHIAVHPGESTVGPTLIELIRKDTNNSEITLCHRIDMNTGGLILLARNKKALAGVIAALKEDKIRKRYRLLVRGIPDVGEPVVCYDGIKMKEIKSFLEKPPGKADVYIHDEAKEGDLDITTRYRILEIFKGVGPQGEDVTELEAELVTGRTHQIRAHFAHIGHPLLGDGKYGRNAYNRHFKGKSGKLTHQQLFSTSLHFVDIQKPVMLSYLSNRIFKIKPDYDIEL
jgi:23S rRNA pseudouridine955/2504/2580 synthase